MMTALDALRAKHRVARSSRKTVRATSTASDAARTTCRDECADSDSMAIAPMKAIQPFAKTPARPR